jgi:hypothetical protein
MKASEILRKLADVIDSAEGGQQAQPMQVAPQQAVPAPVKTIALAPAQEPAAEQPQAAVTTFVPPLQTKIELLKKAVDVDSIYDKGGDELAQMKKMAGIHPVVTDEAGSDEPLDV